MTFAIANAVVLVPAIRLVEWIDQGEAIVSVFQLLPPFLRFIGHPLASFILMAMLLLAIWLKVRFDRVTNPTLLDERGNRVLIFKRKTKTLLKTVLFGTGGALLAGGAIVFIVRATATPVYPPFAALHESHKEQLGVPGTLRADPFVYQGRYQNGIVFWFNGVDNQRPAFYILWTDSNSQQWIRIGDTDADPDPDLENEEKLRERFKPPARLGPPYSGVAKMRRREEEAGGENIWRRLGFREWHCDYIRRNQDDAVHIQEFSGGIIFGGFTRHPEKPTWGLVGFVLLNQNNEWDAQQLSAETPHPACEDPVSRRTALK